jgi:hypothetical protein
MTKIYINITNKEKIHLLNGCMAYLDGCSITISIIEKVKTKIKRLL